MCKKCAKIANFGFYGLNYGKTVEDRWVHAARRLTSIEFSFDPWNIYCDSPSGVGYPADARSVGDSHSSCINYLAARWHLGNAKSLFLWFLHIFIISIHAYDSITAESYHTLRLSLQHVNIRTSNFSRRLAIRQNWKKGQWTAITDMQ